MSHRDKTAETPSIVGRWQKPTLFEIVVERKRNAGGSVLAYRMLKLAFRIAKN